MQHKGKVGFGLGREHACGGKTVVVDERGVVRANPVDRIGWIRDDGIKGLVIAKLRIDEGIAQLNVKFVVIDVVQKHVHPRQVVSGVVDFLPPKPFCDDVCVKMLFGLEQERTRATGGVVDFVDLILLVHGELGDELRDVLRGEEFTA